MKKILLKTGLLPVYSETAIFLSTLTFLLLFFTNPSIRNGFYSVLFEESIDKLVFVAFGAILFLLIGIYFSIRHAFSKSPIDSMEAQVMMFSTLFINAIAGIAAGQYLYAHSGGYLVIFPIWNMISSIGLFYLFMGGFMDETSLSPQQASLAEIFIGSIAIFLIFYMSQYVYGHYWALTFSICIGYATSLNQLVRRLFVS